MNEHNQNPRETRSNPDASGETKPVGPQLRNWRDREIAAACDRVLPLLRAGLRTGRFRDGKAVSAKAFADDLGLRARAVTGALQKISIDQLGLDATGLVLLNDGYRQPLRIGRPGDQGVTRTRLHRALRDAFVRGELWEDGLIDADAFASQLGVSATAVRVALCALRDEEASLAPTEVPDGDAVVEATRLVVIGGGGPRRRFRTGRPGAATDVPALVRRALGRALDAGGLDDGDSIDPTAIGRPLGFSRQTVGAGLRILLDNETPLDARGHVVSRGGPGRRFTIELRNGT